MNLYRHFQDQMLTIVDALADEGTLPGGLDSTRVQMEPSRDSAHGDIATNAAMVLAKPARMKPRDLAEVLSRRLEGLDGVAAVDVAGPGFINLSLTPTFWHDRMVEILEAGTTYGDASLGAGQSINVEYVSANPTGPLHVGHGRGAVVGDSLAALLEKAGYCVTREYYVNDAGGQVDAVARSLFMRYQLATGAITAETFTARCSTGDVQYAGDYLQSVAEELVARDGERWTSKSEDEWLPVFRQFVVERMMTLIQDDLAKMGIHFATVTSERGLWETQRIQSALSVLEGRGLIYTGVLDPPKGKLPDDWEARPQTLFRATRYGDEVDRPLKKSDGQWTYFAADIAYHLDKFNRGFHTMINIWGADHGGYVRRMQAAVDAITDGQATLDVKLCQLVNLLEDGQPVKMSKRAGSFVTLREVIDRVGKDVFRFIMLTRKNDAALDFDFQKVTEQSRENPVFYVQYAHARCCSVLRLAADEVGTESIDDHYLRAASFERLIDDAELDLIKALAGWPRTVESAAFAHEPHRIAYFLQEIAALFHNLWTRGKDDARLRFVHPGDVPLTMARIALVRATQIVIASGLQIIGVEPVQELR